MQPQSPHNTPTSGTDDRKVVVPSRGDTPADRDAAAHLVREQIDRLYDAPSPRPATPVSQAVQEVSHQAHDEAPHVGGAYRRTHGDEGIALGVGSQSDMWEKYHSAWQNYYQQYYQRYYLQQLHASRQKLEQHAKTAHDTSHAKPRWLSEDDTKHEIYSSGTSGARPPHDLPADDGSISKNQAASELKSRLLRQVKNRAHRIRRSHHFMPLVSAIGVGLLFLLVQYNQLLQGQIRAYISPGSISPQNIIIDPNAVTAVGPEPRLVIPKINVDAPVVYGVGTVQEGPIQKALERGVVHYELPGANSVPGQVGNSVILGHSSNDVFAPGDYKFVFALLERMEVGDTFYANYEGRRYTYSVTKKEVIRPSEVGKLIYPTDKPLMTLVTCVPVGTAANRLLVTAEQTSPDPSTAIAAPTPPPVSQQTANIPGTSPTIFERLFGR